MERLPFAQESASINQNSPEEVRGILQRLLRMATRIMALRLFERVQAKPDRTRRKRRLPRS